MIGSMVHIKTYIFNHFTNNIWSYQLWSPYYSISALFCTLLYSTIPVTRYCTPCPKTSDASLTTVLYCTVLYCTLRVLWGYITPVHIRVWHTRYHTRVDARVCHTLRVLYPSIYPSMAETTRLGIRVPESIPGLPVYTSP